jgi:hypothetical protein
MSAYSNYIQNAVSGKKSIKIGCISVWKLVSVPYPTLSKLA